MTSTPDWKLDTRARLRNLSRAAPRYAQAAALPEEITRRLLERLDYIRVSPRRLLDLGSRRGDSTRELKQRYPRAAVVSVDVPAMLAASPSGPGVHRVGAMLPRLPFSTDAFDLIFSSLEVPWCFRVTAALESLREVLAPQGLLMFTTLGPDTLRELRACWQLSDAFEHVHGFFDMHDIGDAMLRAGFADPVMDTERLVATYTDVAALFSDLRGSGAQNVLSDRRRTLTGAGRFHAMQRHYEQFRDREGRLPATCEVIYGHAWGPAADAARPDAPGRTIPVRLTGPGKRPRK